MLQSPCRVSIYIFIYLYLHFLVHINIFASGDDSEESDGGGSGECPCVSSTDFICGWEVNLQLNTSCKAHFIYEPCIDGTTKSKNDNKPISECPNECFYKQGKKDKMTTECGMCEHWTMDNCEKPGKISKEKMVLPKSYNRRPANNFQKIRHMAVSRPERKLRNANNHCPRNKSHFELEFAIIQDASGSYVRDDHEVAGGHNSFVASLKRHINEYLDVLTKEFPNSVYGLTYFVDYSAKTHKRRHDKCYEFIQQLTSDHEEFNNSIHTIPVNQHGGDYPETSLTAILYTAADKKMGWSHTEYRNGKRIIKVLAVTTDEGWKSSSSHKSEGPPPKGDGTDSCKNSLPTIAFVRKILHDNDFFVVAFVAEEVVPLWKQYMWELHMQDRSAVIELDPKTPKKLGAAIIEAVYTVLCLPSAVTTKKPGKKTTPGGWTEEPTEEPSTEPPGGWTEEPTEEPSTEPPGGWTEEPSTEPPGGWTEEPTEEPSTEPPGGWTEEPSTEPPGGWTDEPTEEPSTDATGGWTETPENKEDEYEIWLWNVIAI